MLSHMLVIAAVITPAHTDWQPSERIEAEQSSFQQVPQNGAAAPGLLKALPPERLLSLDSRTLTGDWGGFRPSLEQRGVRFSMFLNNHYQAVLKGGADSEGSGRNSASLDAFLTFDLDKLDVIPNAEVLLHLQANWGAGINPRTGAQRPKRQETTDIRAIGAGNRPTSHNFFRGEPKISLDTSVAVSVTWGTCG